MLVARPQGTGTFANDLDFLRVGREVPVRSLRGSERGGRSSRSPTRTAAPGRPGHPATTPRWTTSSGRPGPPATGSASTSSPTSSSSPRARLRSIILFNEGQPGRTAVPDNLPLGAEGVHIPGVGTSFDVGVDLSDPGTVARVKTEVLEETATSVNVIAESRRGDPNRTVVVGAHLDSVPAGPGINDNGSGSAAILEMAEELSEHDITPRNKLRFMWCGAEELGLVGSTKYVDELTQDQKDDILAMLNFDMIGSPNFARFVYDGDGTAGPEGPTGSGFIEDVFADYFAAVGLFNEPTAFDGRSDYGPFIAEGIPAGGLFTGAEVHKTAEQVAQYGGIADAQFDPCYHAACDTFAGSGDGPDATAPGLGLVALDQMSDAAAHAVYVLAKTRVDVRNTPN